MDHKPTYYEFFAGGGMARAGLGDAWRCAFANDFDPKKAAAYRASWGRAEMICEDIYKLSVDQLPGTADLAWASFPCQDLSLAGNGKGLAGERSGTFRGFADLVRNLGYEGRAPKALLIENVVGILTSNEGRDFEEICREIATLGYVFGAMVIDAAHFVPQSRPRFFLLAVRKDVPHRHLVRGEPTGWMTTRSLLTAHDRLRPDLRARWRWWSLQEPQKRSHDLIDVLEDEPAGVNWHSPEETRRLIALMSDVNLRKLSEARARKGRVVGTVYRRTRADSAGNKRQRAELRLDGIAGCLRTPGGGSSRQFLLEIEGDNVRSRLISAREAARLMGWPEDKPVPANNNEAYHLFGDGLAVPVVGWIGELATELVRHEMVLEAAE